MCVKVKICERITAVEVLNLALYLLGSVYLLFHLRQKWGGKKNLFCLKASFSCFSLLINPPVLYLAAAQEALFLAHQICKCTVTHSIPN